MNDGPNNPIPDLPGVAATHAGVWGPPRLLTRHLLVWFAIASPLIVFARYAFYRLNSWPLDFSNYFLFAAIAHAILMGGAMVVAGIVARGMWQGRPQFDEPGQWLAVELSIRCIAYLTVLSQTIWLDSISRRGQATYEDEDPLHLAWIIGWLILVLVDTLAAIWCRAALVWRLMFFLKAALAIVVVTPAFLVLLDRNNNVLEELWWIILPMQVLLLAMLFWTALSDVRRGAIRHWTHWYGVIAHAMLTATMIASFLFVP